MEIERKWLVAGDPPLAGAASSSAIRQGYVAVAPDGGEVRVRARDDARVLTVKQGTGLVRGEVETEISAALFDALWPLTEGRRVEKVRHLVALGAGLVAEVDVFAGALAGLVLVEVEFPDRGAAVAFAPPPWFGADVTEDKAYKNQALALTGRPPGAAGSP